jgi:uncharacterized protein YrrD
MADSAPVSWRTIIYGTPLVSSDGQRVGEVHEVLGDDADDIFHGLRVALAGAKRDVMVAADDVDSLASDAISVSLTKAELEAAPTYEEEATYHLASVGWLRKHLGWQRDSRSDEEAG